MFTTLIVSMPVQSVLLIPLNPTPILTFATSIVLKPITSIISVQLVLSLNTMFAVSLASTLAMLVPLVSLPSISRPLNSDPLACLITFTLTFAPLIMSIPVYSVFLIPLDTIPILTFAPSMVFKVTVKPIASIIFVQLVIRKIPIPKSPACAAFCHQPHAHPRCATSPYPTQKNEEKQNPGTPRIQSQSLRTLLIRVHHLSMKMAATKTRFQNFFQKCCSMKIDGQCERRMQQHTKLVRIPPAVLANQQKKEPVPVKLPFDCSLPPCVWCGCALGQLADF